MYGFLFRPRWLAFHALVLAGIVLMVNLGIWQLHRLDERREFNATVAERIDLPPVPLDELLAELDGGDPASIEWRQVTVRGEYVADQVSVFNRSQNGRAGDNILTALRVDGDVTVLVNRGFVALGSDVPPAPTATVDVLGRVRPSQVRRSGELTDATPGALTEIRRVDIDRLSPQFGGDLVPVYLDLIDSRPPIAAGDPEPVPPPELTEGPHLSYAMQWFIFSACVAVGWVLAVRRSIRTARGAVDAPASADA